MLVVLVLGVWSLLLVIIDLTTNFYTPKFTPGSNPGVWEPKVTPELIAVKKGRKNLHNRATSSNAVSEILAPKNTGSDFDEKSSNGRKKFRPKKFPSKKFSAENVSAEKNVDRK